MRDLDELLTGTSIRRQLDELARSPFEDLKKAIELADPVRASLDQFRKDQERHRSLIGDLSRHTTGSLRQLMDDSRLQIEHLSSFPRYDDIMRAAEITQGLHLPDILASHRLATDEIALGLSRISSFEHLQVPQYLKEFNQASAFAAMQAEFGTVTQSLLDANLAFMKESVSGISLPDYRQLLDAAGLILPRWPRVRRLTAKEKKAKFKSRLNQNVEPRHVTRAKSLVHRYELTLRGILEDVMESQYGDDWPHDRLPICDCKDLLGKWVKRGGNVLDHADYAHYARIVSHPEHFQAIFQMAFDDAGATYDLFVRAGRLRAASHHGHGFTPDDLRDLRVIWSTIEKALIHLSDDLEFEIE